MSSEPIHQTPVSTPPWHRRWRDLLWPAPVLADPKERLRAALGAGLGLLVRLSARCLTSTLLGPRTRCAGHHHCDAG